MMARSLYFLLLLAAHSVSAVLTERHYMFHIHSVHFNPLQNASVRYLERSASILLDGRHMQYYSDGKTMASAQMEKSWRSRTRGQTKKQTPQKEFEHFSHLLDIGSNETHHYMKRSGCVIERSSSGNVTLLKSTVEYRHNGTVILYFNVHKDHWVAVDRTFLPVKMQWDSSFSLYQITKNYLLQGCVEMLLKYLDAKDRNEISESEVLMFFTGNMPEPWPLREGYWSFLLIMFLSVSILIVCNLHRRRKCLRCALCSYLKVSLITGAIRSALLCFTKRRTKPPAEDSADDDSEDKDKDNDDGGGGQDCSKDRLIENGL
ncbi:uncharacterized protein LOC108412342 [Pygocentrus nattereri]|uniref:uncharacterized protein LOC108412342 n=1 Tax=Pygocentrus nattereri TaxID=42514 RepID=UPI0008148518|nr:uncharacterized protein LOC108412342 [Pygocentrus nattereri]